jgi:hsp70-interacting protein
MSDPGQWLGLLKWSLAYQDGTYEKEEAKEMDHGRRQWLQEAMSELIVDEAKLMKEIVEKLSEMSKQEECVEAEVTDKYEQLEDMIENLDAAYDLVKMGKMDTLIELLRSTNPIFRVGAAAIIGTCAQNNPKCQAAELQLGALAYTTHMAVYDQDPTARLKALLAVSCLSRNCVEGERAFVDQGDGLLVLANGLVNGAPRFQAKCAYLILFFLTEDSLLRDEATQSRHAELAIAANVPHLAGQLIESEDVNVRLGCLELLTRLGAPADEELMGRMNARLAVCAQDEDLQDERELLEALYKSLLEAL